MAQALMVAAVLLRCLSGGNPDGFQEGILNSPFSTLQPGLGDTAGRTGCAGETNCSPGSMAIHRDIVYNSGWMGPHCAASGQVRSRDSASHVLRETLTVFPWCRKVQGHLQGGCPRCGRTEGTERVRTAMEAQTWRVRDRFSSHPTPSRRAGITNAAVCNREKTGKADSRDEMPRFCRNNGTGGG